jgi:hypothetical protein
MVVLSPSLCAQYLGGSGDGASRELFRGTANGAQVATQIVFTASPVFVAPTESFTVLAEIRDASGNVAAFSSLSNASVSLAIDNNPASGTLSGTTPVTAVDAVASFSSMSIDNIGFGYSLEATASTLSATSSSFDVFNMYGGGSGDGAARSLGPQSTQNGQSIVIWRGGASGNETDWATAANWADGVPATTGDIIYLEPNGNGHHPVLAAHTQIATLNFNGAEKKVELGNFDLTITEGIGLYGATAYVRSNGTGRLVKDAIADQASFTFPVGDSSYNPLTITNKTTVAEWFSLRVLNEVYDYGDTGTVQTVPRVQRTWDIGKETSSGYSGTVDFDFQWNLGEEAGTINTYVLFHYGGLGNGWAEALSGTGTHSSQRLVYTGYTGDFSPFGIGDQTQPLPVDLLHFNAACGPGRLDFDWATASEVNNRVFVVEQSTDATLWQALAEQAGAGYSSSKRSYALSVPFEKVQGPYFRLYQEDYDGTREYFQGLHLECAGFAGGEWQLAPNPAGLQSYAIGLEGDLDYRILDLQGRVVRSGRLSEANGYRMDLNGLPPGMYQVHSARGVKALIKLPD